eukprot:8902361-Ditylum_brightwellii.AAC.1
MTSHGGSVTWKTTIALSVNIQILWSWPQLGEMAMVWKQEEHSNLSLLQLMHKQMRNGKWECGPVNTPITPPIGKSFGLYRKH